MRPVVIVPTYNEMDSLPRLVERLQALPLPPHVLVVDDASPDGTGGWAEERARAGGLSVIRRGGKLGLGTAYLEGFRRALAEGFDPIITMDSDLSHPPEVIPDMLRLIREGDHDLVIGSRYVPGGGTRNWPASRIFLSTCANFVARTLLRFSPRDCTAGFRCYRADLLRRLPLDEIRADGYSFLVELLFLCTKARARMTEVPIVFEDRRFGQSKISRSEISRGVLTVFRLAIR